MTTPDFIIIGAQKSGTSAVTKMLRKHPSIYMPGRELHFFDKRDTTWHKYVSNFPPNKVSGEKTPKYMADPVAMTFLQRKLPAIKLIIILRDPVIRFVSGCQHWNRKRSGEYIGLKRFINTPEGQLALWRGRYADQLSYIHRLFPNEGQLCIIISEELRAHTIEVMDAVQEFIGVVPKAMNNKPGEDRKVVGKPVYEELCRYYAEPNKLLYEATGMEAIKKWHAAKS